jgi:hypothetical protein
MLGNALAVDIEIRTHRMYVSSQLVSLHNHIFENP